MAARLLRFAFFVGPTALVTAWGGIYIVNCLQTLSAPGAGMKLLLSTEGGAIGLNVGSYALDPASGTLIASNAKLSAPDGSTLLECGRIHISGLWLTGKVAPKVRLSELDVTLRRDTKGTFELASFLPKSTDDKPSEIPFEVRADRVSVRYIDARIKDPARRALRASLTDVLVRGFGEDLSVRARAMVPSAAIDLAAAARKRGDTITGRASLQANNLGQTLELLQLIPESKDLSLPPNLVLDSGRAALTGRFRLDPKKPLALLAKAAVQDVNGRYDSLAFARANATGPLTERGFVGSFDATAVSAQVNGIGAITWANGILAGVEIRGKGANIGKLAKQFGQSVQITGTASGTGYLTFESQPKSRPKLMASAAISAQNIRYDQISVPRANLDLSTDGTELVVSSDQLQVAGGQLRGFAKVNLAKNSIDGIVDARGIDVDQAPIKLPSLLRTGRATAQIGITGLLVQPIVEGYGAIPLKIRLGEKVIDLGEISSAASYANGKWKLSRSVVDSAIGKGWVSLSGDAKSLSGQVRLRGIDLAQLYPDVNGIGDFAGQISGTFNRPQFKGRFEGYNLAFQGYGATAASVDLTFRDNELRLRDLVAVKGAGAFFGSGSYSLKNGSLGATGRAEAIPIGDYTDGLADGIVSLENIRLKGTIAKPELTADLSSDGLVASSIKVDQVAGKLRYANNILELSQTKLGLLQGEMSLSGSYNPSTASGLLEFDARNLNVLESIADRIENFTANGLVSGEGSVRIRNKKLANFAAAGRLQDITLNKTPFGSGQWDVQLVNGAVAANAIVGQIDRYVRLAGVGYDLEKETLTGGVEIAGLEVKDAVSVASPSLQLDARQFEQLRLLGGSIFAGFTLDGKVSTPKIALDGLTVERVRYADSLLGQLDGKGVYEKGAFTLSELMFKGPLGNLIAHGTGNDEGKLNLSADLFGLDLGKLSPIIPELGNVSATIGSASISLTGSLDAPQIRGSLDATIGKRAEEQSTASLDPLDRPAHILVEDFLFAPRPKSDPASDVSDSILGLASVRGQYSYSFLKGPFDGFVGVDLRKGLVKSDPLNFNLAISERSLDELVSIAPGLKIPAKSGLIKGNLGVRGTPDNPILSGEVSAEAPQLEINLPKAALGNDLIAPLANLRAKVSLDRTKVNANMSLQSAMSSDPKNPLTGSAVLNANLDLDPLFSGKSNGWELIPIQGTFNLADFRLFQGYESGYLDARVSTESPILLSNTLSKPSVRGAFDLTSVNIKVPSFTPQESEPSPSRIDPQFDLIARIKQPGRVLAATAEIYLIGEAQLRGALSDPTFFAELQTSTITNEQSTLRLPGGQVTLDSGGRFNFRVQNSTTNADVNLTGRTNLTTLRDGINPERYDIKLTIVGDILKPNGLTYTASSTPADLSQDRIIALLGRTDLIDTAFNADQAGLQRELQEAITSFMLPNLLGGITNSLAKSFGLDYVNVDYNPFEGYSASLARSLGNGVFIIARRQLVQPLPNQLQRFDFRLSLRPQFGPEAVRSLTFSIGVDQDRPYKVAIEYGRRFALQKPPNRTIKIDVP